MKSAYANLRSMLKRSIRMGQSWIPKRYLATRHELRAYERAQGTIFGIENYYDKARNEAEVWGSGLSAEEDHRSQAGWWYNSALVEYWQEFFSSYKELFLKYLRDKRGKGLEICCGTGYLVRTLAPETEIEWEACDLSERLAKEGSGLAEEQGLNIRFYQKDVNFLDLEENSFDVIITNHGLHHLANLNNVLRVCEMGLKPGGRFLAIDTLPVERNELNNMVFKKVWNSLPEKYKTKRHGTIERPEGPFEGLGYRFDIEGLLKETFRTLCLRKFHSLAYRIFEYQYNWDLTKAEDKELVSAVFTLDKLLIDFGVLEGAHIFFVGEKRVSQRRSL